MASIDEKPAPSPQKPILSIDTTINRTANNGIATSGAGATSGTPVNATPLEGFPIASFNKWEDNRSPTEKFPVFASRRNSSAVKPKSLTDAEVKEAMNPTELAARIANLKVDPPMSLEEARERRASNTKLRKDSVNFIRSRTVSRAAKMEQDKRIEQEKRAAASTVAASTAESTGTSA